MCKHMSEILARDIVACISTCVKSMYKKVKHRYIQKSVRQTCSKEGIDSGGTAGGVPSGRRSPGSPQVNNHPGYQLGL